MNRSIRVLSLAAALVASAQMVEASLIAYEGFNYTAGATLQGSNGGTGFSTAWAPDVNGGSATIVSGSLNDPTSTLVTSGNKVQENTGNPATSYLSINRKVSTALGVGTTTQYFSVLLNPQTFATDSSGALGGGAGFMLNGGALGIGRGMGSNKWEIMIGKNASSIAPVANQAALLVLSASFNTSGNDVFKLYVNPTPGAAEPVTADATYTVANATNTSLHNFQRVDLIADRAWQFDEIRIGTTFADVTTAIPEPASILGLMSAGGLLMLRRRQRH